MGGGFRMIQVHYIYCALYFYYYYIVIYNEIIIQLSLTTPLSVRCWCESASNWFIMFSVQTSLLMIICICSRSPALASLSQLHLRSPGVRFSYGADHLDLSRGQFLVGFVLLRESNATAGLTWGSAQAATWGMCSSCRYRCGFIRSPTVHLLLCGPVPNRPQTSPGDPWFHSLRASTKRLRKDQCALSQGEDSSSPSPLPLRLLLGHTPSALLVCRLWVWTGNTPLVSWTSSLQTAYLSP